MLFVYDFEFNLLLAEPQVIQSRWTIYYNDIGTFEAHLPLTSELTRIVSVNPYLVVKEHGLSAVIVGKEVKNELILYGRTCNWLMTKRLTPAYLPGMVMTGDTVVQMVTDAFCDVEKFVVGTMVSGTEAEFEKKESTTFDAVRHCLELSKLGHELRFDEKGKKWEFNILCGCENNLILSETHRNAYDTAISEDILDLVTCGYFDKDGNERVIVYADEAKTGIYRWEAKLSAETEPEAQQELQKLCANKQVTMSVSDVFWGKDYNLGDRLVLKIVKGPYRITEKRRIKGVEICVEKGVYTEQPIFE